jgi:uncharacterized protein YggU (UPF0235/DUF167 family)
MLAGTRDGALLIRLAAAPVDGAANAELVALLAAILDIPKRNIAVVAGEKTRNKRVRIAGLSRAEVLARIDAAGGK